jgi:AsmA protein
MKGVIKGIVIAVLGAVALLALAVVLLVTLVNPNDYREDISRIARDSAGVELKLGGDLSWRFYPVLGFGAADVGLALRSGQPELVHIGEMAVGVRIIPLLSGKIEIDALDIGGLKANLIVNEKGENNWQMADSTAPATATEAPATATAGEPPAPTTASTTPDVFIPLVRIHSSTIHYEDKPAKAAYTVDLPLLELKDVNLKEPFPLLLEARVRDQAGLDVNTRLEGNVSALLESKQFGIDNMNLAAEIAGIVAKPLALNLQGSARFDQQQDKADVTLERLQLANLVARLQVAATTVTTAPAFKGQLASDVFNAKELLTTLGMDAPVTQDANALTRVQFNTDFAGTPDKVALKPLTLKLDASTLNGEVSVVDVSKQAIRFALQLDKLDADQYLPPPAPETAATAAPAPKAAPSATAAAEELIPVETLRTLNLKGTFKAGEVIVQKIPMRDIALSIKAIDGDIQITDLGAKLLQGSLAGKVLLDARQAQPKITTQIDLNQIEVSELMKPFVSAQLLSGRTSLKLDTTTTGNDMDTLLKQALGQINLNMANTVVHGVNVNQIALDAVKSKLGDFTALMPDYQDKLPKALKGDTEIRNLLANMVIENGHLLMPDFSADTGEGQLSASGDIDLLQKGFDYRFGVVLSALDDNKYLKGVKWPVRCKGNLETAATDWCRPDSKAVGKALEQAATVALRDKGAQELGKKLGMDNADEAAVKEELRQKAKAEEDKAKKKLNESLKKFLEKQ